MSQNEARARQHFLLLKYDILVKPPFTKTENTKTTHNTKTSSIRPKPNLSKYGVQNNMQGVINQNKVVQIANKASLQNRKVSNVSKLSNKTEPVSNKTGSIRSNDSSPSRIIKLQMPQGLSIDTLKRLKNLEDKEKLVEEKIKRLEDVEKTQKEQIIKEILAEQAKKSSENSEKLVDSKLDDSKLDDSKLGEPKLVDSKLNESDDNENSEINVPEPPARTPKIPKRGIKTPEPPKRVEKIATENTYKSDFDIEMEQKKLLLREKEVEMEFIQHKIDFQEVASISTISDDRNKKSVEPSKNTNSGPYYSSPDSKIQPKPKTKLAPTKNIIQLEKSRTIIQATIAASSSIAPTAPDRQPATTIISEKSSDPPTAPKRENLLNTKKVQIAGKKIPTQILAIDSSLAETISMTTSDSESTDSPPALPEKTCSPKLASSKIVSPKVSKTVSPKIAKKSVKIETKAVSEDKINQKPNEELESEAASIEPPPRSPHPVLKRSLSRKSLFERFQLEKKGIERLEDRIRKISDIEERSEKSKSTNQNYPQNDQNTQNTQNTKTPPESAQRLPPKSPSAPPTPKVPTRSPIVPKRSHQSPLLPPRRSKTIGQFQIRNFEKPEILSYTNRHISSSLSSISSLSTKPNSLPGTIPYRQRLPTESTIPEPIPSRKFIHTPSELAETIPEPVPARNKRKDRNSIAEIAEPVPPRKNSVLVEIAEPIPPRKQYCSDTSEISVDEPEPPPRTPKMVPRTPERRRPRTPPRTKPETPVRSKPDTPPRGIKTYHVSSPELPMRSKEISEIETVMRDTPPLPKKIIAPLINLNKQHVSQKYKSASKQPPLKIAPRIPSKSVSSKTFDLEDETTTISSINSDSDISLTTTEISSSQMSSMAAGYKEKLHTKISDARTSGAKPRKPSKLLEARLQKYMSNANKSITDPIEVSAVRPRISSNGSSQRTTVSKNIVNKSATIQSTGFFFKCHENVTKVSKIDF